MTWALAEALMLPLVKVWQMLVGQVDSVQDL